LEPFDSTRPNIARVWDYWLGGKDNFAADRELARKLLEVHPPSAQMARVAYVDNDPMVISHARGLLARSPGVIAVPGDMRDPGHILTDPWPAN